MPHTTTPNSRLRALVAEWRDAQTDDTDDDTELDPDTMITDLEEAIRT